MCLGDRSHPNLQLVDKLKRQLMYDGHQEDLERLEQAHFKGSNAFDRISRTIVETDKMSRGDRSHWNLVRLDRLKMKLTYDGWRDDFQNAEQRHLHYVHCPDTFDHVLKGLERKQKVSEGDRSDENLKILDSLQLSYPHWQEDWQEAFRHYKKGFDLKKSRELFLLKEKQRMHDGNRSHPRLVALDSLQLTYPGWEGDVHLYEQAHVKSDSSLVTKVRDMQRRQDEHLSVKEDLSWMHPDQRNIVETQWTFSGWEKKVERVRTTTSRHFDDKLEEFQVCQMAYDGDFTRHPLLIELNSMNLTYPGWKDDLDDCKRALPKSIFWKAAFKSNMKGMKHKQAVYDGYIKSCSEKERSKPQAKNEETGLKECVVCWETTRSHVFVPCGHLAACKSCSDKIMVGGRKNCPVCNQVVTMTMEVFHP